MLHRDAQRDPATTWGGEGCSRSRATGLHGADFPLPDFTHELFSFPTRFPRVGKGLARRELRARAGLGLLLAPGSSWALGDTHRDGFRGRKPNSLSNASPGGQRGFLLLPLGPAELLRGRICTTVPCAARSSHPSSSSAMKSSVLHPPSHSHSCSVLYLIWSVRRAPWLLRPFVLMARPDPALGEPARGGETPVLTARELRAHSTAGACGAPGEICSARSPRGLAETQNPRLYPQTPSDNHGCSSGKA